MKTANVEGRTGLARHVALLPGEFSLHVEGRKGGWNENQKVLADARNSGARSSTRSFNCLGNYLPTSPSLVSSLAVLEIISAKPYTELVVGQRYP